MTIEFGRTAQDYAQHRAGFPDTFFDRLLALGWVRPGETVLDLGTGTGTVARGLALRGCLVTGLDPSRTLLDQARRLDQAEGVEIRQIEAKAEHTGLSDHSLDVVTAGQCWHWFDRPAAAREVRRVLRPQGRLIIGHFDWLPLPGNVVALTEALIEAHNPAWTMGGMTGLHPRWLTDAATAGFWEIETFSFDVATLYSHEAWRGRIRASAGVGASLAPDEVARFDQALDAALRATFPADPLRVPHRVWVMSAVSPG